jgi:hypothetical protein
VLVAAATFLAAQVDFVRRHHVGMSAEQYWKPQFIRIWLPGLGATLLLGALVFVLHRRGPRA